MLKPLFALTAAMSVAHDAFSEIDLSAEAALSSMLIDRGEQIGGPAFETGLAAEKPFGPGAAYASIYRLTPIGDDQDAFADEFDYTLGYAWEGEGYAADLSANWLTYPGEGDEASLELAGEIALDLPFNPTMAGFYDADFEDFGLEAAAGPEWQAGGWTLYAIGRAGFVEPGDGSASRSYGGVELGGRHPLGEQAEIGAYARYEIADEDSFADDIVRGNITSMTNTGLAAGILVSTSF